MSEQIQYQTLALTPKQIKAMRLVLRLMTYSTVMDLVMGVARGEDGPTAAASVLMAMDNSRTMDRYLLLPLEVAFARAGTAPIDETQVLPVKLPGDCVSVISSLMAIPRSDAIYKLSGAWGDDWQTVKAFIEGEHSAITTALTATVASPAEDRFSWVMSQPKGKQ